MTIVFQVLGEGTRKMGEFEKGEYFADVVGPLGQPSELIHTDIDELKRKNISL